MSISDAVDRGRAVDRANGLAGFEESFEMSQLSVVGIAGNVTRPSRSSALVSAVLKAVEERTNASLRLIELIDVGPTLLSALTPDQLGADGKALIRAIEGADLIV